MWATLTPVQYSAPAASADGDRLGPHPRKAREQEEDSRLFCTLNSPFSQHLCTFPKLEAGLLTSFILFAGVASPSTYVPSLGT